MNTLNCWRDVKAAKFGSVPVRKLLNTNRILSFESKAMEAGIVPVRPLEPKSIMARPVSVASEGIVPVRLLRLKSKCVKFTSASKAGIVPLRAFVFRSTYVKLVRLIIEEGI